MHKTSLGIWRMAWRRIRQQRTTKVTKSRRTMKTREMKMLLKMAAVVILAVAALGQVLWAQSPASTSPQPTTKKKSAAKTSAHATTKKSTQSTNTKVVAKPRSFDQAAMDKSADPCEDFYQYACGGWRKSNPIPADQSRWGRFSELAEYNRQVLRGILERASVKSAKRTPVMQKIGDFYATCMDEKGVNAKGAAPLKPELERIAAISNKAQLLEAVAYLQGLGVQALFGFNSAPD